MKKLISIVIITAFLFAMLGFTSYAEGIVWNDLDGSTHTFESVQELELGTNEIESVCCSFTAEDTGYYLFGDWEVYSVSNPVVSGCTIGDTSTWVYTFDEYTSGFCGGDEGHNIQKVNAGDTVCLFVPNEYYFPTKQSIVYLGNSVTIEPYKSGIIFDSEVYENDGYFFNVPVKLSFESGLEYILRQEIYLGNTWSYGKQEKELNILNKVVKYNFDIVKIDDYIKSVSVIDEADITVGRREVDSNLCNSNLEVIITMTDGKVYEGHTRTIMDLVGTNMELGDKAVEVIYNYAFNYGDNSATVYVEIANKQYAVEIPAEIRKADIASEFASLKEDIDYHISSIKFDIKYGNFEDTMFDIRSMFYCIRIFINFIFKSDLRGEYIGF